MKSQIADLLTKTVSLSLYSQIVFSFFLFISPYFTLKISFADRKLIFFHKEEPLQPQWTSNDSRKYTRILKY